MKQQHGNLVIVSCERGYNVGFIDQEIDINSFQNNGDKEEGDHFISKKILNHVSDEDQTIRNLLKEKIAAENYALAQCKMHVKGRKLAIYSDIISTEFQFDRKKLIVYLKKYQEISVCRLVRYLYETFQVRIKVLEVEDANVLYDMAQKYHEISKLNLPFSDIFHFDLKETIGPLCLPPEHQQPQQPNPRREHPKITKNPHRPRHEQFESRHHPRVTPSLRSQRYAPHIPPPHDPSPRPPYSFPPGSQIPNDHYNSPSFSSTEFTHQEPISARMMTQSFSSFAPFTGNHDWHYDSEVSFSNNFRSGPVDETNYPQYSYFSTPDSHHRPTVPSMEHSFHATETISSALSGLFTTTPPQSLSSSFQDLPHLP